MTFVDTNLTYSQQVCDLAVGSIIGAGAIYIFIFKLLFVLMGFFAIYRVTEIFIRRYKFDNITQSKSNTNRSKR